MFFAVAVVIIIFTQWICLKERTKERKKEKLDPKNDDNKKKFSFLNVRVCCFVRWNNNSSIDGKSVQ